MFLGKAKSNRKNNFRPILCISLDNCILIKIGMKKIILITLLISSLTLSFGQKVDIKTMVDSLQDIKVDTFNCNADLYWRIVAKGKDAIPFLIDKLTDTTQTNIKYHCKKMKLNVGEVAQFALTEIAYFPAFLVTKLQFDLIIVDETGQGCWSFYDFLFINSNKPRYQKSVREWYNKEKAKYKATNISEEQQTECQKKFGVDTYYRWTE